MITQYQFAQLLPDNASPQAGIFYGPLIAAMQQYDITTKVRQAAFLAQVLHESEGITALEESFKYSPARLQVVFSKHFPSAAVAAAYAGQPQKIANRVYAGRLGNGDEASGDGWRFRGRGLLQMTFHDNYLLCGMGLGLDLLESPDLLCLPENAAMSAAWFWGNRGINAIADAGDVRTVTVAVNGGINGLDERAALYQQALGVLQ